MSSLDREEIQRSIDGLENQISDLRQLVLDPFPAAVYGVDDHTLPPSATAHALRALSPPPRPRIDMTANYLTTEILLAITKHKLGVAWRSNRIDAMAVGRGGRQRRVQAGINGQADITGILPDGRRIEVEIKVGKDKQSPAQISFQRMIEKHGGIYIVARDIEGCVAAIKARMAVPGLIYGRMGDL